MCLGPDLMKNGVGIGCSRGIEAVRQIELGEGYQNICEYADDCSGARDFDRFNKECIEGGKYCIIQLIHLEQEK